MKCLLRRTLCFLAAAIVLPAAGQLVRVPNTSLTNVPPQPPVFGYILNNAFTGLSFIQPVCLAAPPGETNRLFVLGKLGTMWVITNLAAPNMNIVMTLPVISDSESGLIGLAFHPGFATNRLFYIFSSRTNLTQPSGDRYQCISRFQMTATNNNIALTNTEQVLIAQFDRAPNHNGGDLHFGPDGYLYASVGDEGAQYNGDLNAQVITNNYFSAIMRLDVDKRPGNLFPNPNVSNSTNYFIPADNPFVGVTNFNGQTFAATNVRTEFFAIGFRNPWRFNFDPLTQTIYVGDVGQDDFEEVDIITNGANCGWPYYEGLHAAPALYPGQPGIYANPPPGLVFPIQEYPHSGTATLIGNSIIGGIVYRGNRLSQLYGNYVFTDNGSGNVWMLNYNGSNTVPYQRITAASGPSSLGADPRNGDVLIAQLNNSQIGRLDYNATSSGAPLPPTLADTGVFS
ncbi:MAG TPA: PQQ-dependent sugar dehydrogenase, partial [Verrucomicrobiae bacterium]|nr:PQQ-dependent sugar dehydrogenase [Verrucomicrobiae bacterium]